jgi:acetoacetyl-CoA synthetase
MRRCGNGRSISQRLSGLNSGISAAWWATRGTVLRHGDKMPGAQWFPEARLNYAGNVLQRRDDGEALVFWGEDKVKRRMTRVELVAEVGRFQQFLRAAGVGEGDRVAGYLPNLPETLIAMLAATALGAIWSSASPDFGVQGVLDRFGQIEPKVLICVDGYWYNGKAVDCLAKNAEIVAKMPSCSRSWSCLTSIRPRI